MTTTRRTVAVVALLLTAVLSGCDSTSDDAAPTSSATQAAPSVSAAPGTEADATMQIACSVTGGEPTSSCTARVTRNWGDDGTTLVEVSKPDGYRRALFFRGTTPYGADSAESDGSAGFDFTVTRDGDASVIVFGPERYIVPDAFVLGN
ncbi:hypothetical protein [Gordonia rhizosphera]|uniref:Lipoprotein n=1 Tax=Gordonia rhizosphera NBRC 16068 TaxID=1108045 RepID=K6WMX8_9ACTN|nr:hypothetical protein [Gordonia rhizosphera]GAB93497.1 hypothetical protein GORHZ_225_00200 [Gordonia rhizosphera NBRC 16068]